MTASPHHAHSSFIRLLLSTHLTAQESTESVFLEKLAYFYMWKIRSNVKIKENLLNLLANGQTGKVIKKLNALAKSDNELHSQTITLSARYQKFLREKHGGTNDSKYLDLELNRINAAALDLIDQVSDDVNLSVKKWSWQKITFWLSIFAAVVTITGYTMKDFFQQKKSPPPAFSPPSSKLPPDTTSASTLPIAIEKAASTKGESKSSVTIEVKDHAKVGNVIMGDSNEIDIKQDF